MRRSHLIGAVIAVVAVGAVAAVLLAAFDVFGGSSTANRPEKAGVAASQTRELPAFRSVELDGNNNVSISVGKRQSVVVHGDRSAVQRVTTRVVAGNLVIGNTPGQLTSRSAMHVEITMPWLSALRLAGNGVLSAEDLAASPLTVSLSGAGIIKASGISTDLEVRLGGSGAVELEHLVARNAVAVLGGTGQIFVNATNSLEASISGSGAIMYIDRPAHLATTVTGTGAILPLEL